MGRGGTRGSLAATTRITVNSGRRCRGGRDPSVYCIN